MTGSPRMAVHGGAGQTPPGDRARAAAERELAVALRAGWAILQAGGGAIDAVEAAVGAMERSGCFNAGRGAVADRDGRISLDASVMDGPTRATGAVGCVRKISIAISAARRVMDETPHVLLVGSPADAFALAAGVPAASDDSFIHAGLAAGSGGAGTGTGTVGAVACDAAGHVAAATATGGLSGKLPGRVGDSAVIGAGTWADDRCAVSATGSGEHFIRTGFAHQVAWGVSRLGLSLAEACRRALADVVGLGGHGGCIAIDDAGNVVMPFSTAMMYRGVIDQDGPPRVAIFPARLGPEGREARREDRR